MVLGANGFMGENLVKRLLPENRVIGYGTRPAAFATDGLPYQHICGDFSRETRFEEILRDYQISIIYHLISTTTPKVGTDHAEREIQENLLPTIRLLEAATTCGIERIIFPSSGGTVYGEYSGRPHREVDSLLPTCSYGIQKMTIEAYLQLYARLRGLDSIIARIGNPYGCCTQKYRTQGVIPAFIRALMKDNEITLFGNTIRDYVFIEDVTDALIRMMEYSGSERIFNIASGHGTHLCEVVKIIETVAGKEFHNVKMEDMRSCDVAENILDISRAERELGWIPHISLQQGIQRTYQQMLNME